MNKIIFLGNICNDIEFKEINNVKIATFNLAVQRKFKNNNGEYETDFFKITAFNNQATFINNYFSKGRKILVECHAQNRTWEDSQTGAKRYATDFIVEDTYFADSKKEAQTSEVQAPTEANDWITVEEDEMLPF